MPGGFNRFSGALCATAAVLAAAGCGAADSAVDPADQEAPVPEDTYGGVMPAVQAPLPEGFDTHGVEGIRVAVPEDWEVQEPDGALCALPPESEDCRYGAFYVFPHVSERQNDEWPSEHYDEEKGWAPDTGRCRSRATAADGDEKTDDHELIVDNAFGDHPDPAADDGLRRSHYRVWNVTCKNDDTFQIRLWYLPESDVAAYVWSVDSRYEDVYTEMAESMDVTDYLN